MWTRRVALTVALATSHGIASGAFAGGSGVVLQGLRLNVEGKVQVDIIVRSNPPPDGGRVEVEFTDSRGAEIVTVVGLTAVNVRRIATTTRPLACGESEQVTATVVAPEHVKGSTVEQVLRRQCEALRD